MNRTEAVRERSYVFNAGFWQRERDVEGDPNEEVGAADKAKRDVRVTTLKSVKSKIQWSPVKCLNLPTPSSLPHAKSSVILCYKNYWLAKKNGQAILNR